MSNNLGKGTVGIHGGYSPKSGEPRVLPIYQSATYKYDDPDTLEALFALKAEGHLYSRISNPTVGALEDKVCKIRRWSWSSSNSFRTISNTLCSFKYL